MVLIEKLINIANAVRKKTGKTETMTLNQIANEIEGISGDTSGVETVAVTIETSNFSGKVRYTDDKYGFNELTLEVDSTYTIECIKGSFIAFSGYGFKCDGLQPNFFVDYAYDPDNGGMQVYYFNTDTILNIYNCEGW